MAETKTGTIGWLDLTVEDASAVRDFYEQVVGWSSSGVDMDGYEDFAMIPPGQDSPAAGVCHARGPNLDVPPYWIVYLMVDDLERSLDAVRDGGGSLVSGPKSAGAAGRYCIIRDPAGAFVGLFEADQ